MTIQTYESDNLIYNRFDLIFDSDVCCHKIYYNDLEYRICSHCEGTVATLNVWGKSIPDEVMKSVIEDIKKKFRSVNLINITRMRNDYRDQLGITAERIIYLPETEEELLGRMKQKGRYHFQKNLAKLQDLGKLKIKLYSTPIPDDIGNAFFEWKYRTHGRNFGMLPSEYMKKQCVTDAMSLHIGNEMAAVLLFCQNEGTVYFENFSYSEKFQKYSPGFLIYEMFLNEMINRHCYLVFLGSAEYDYKKRFGSVEYPCYSGNIYLEGYFERLNEYFVSNNVKRIVIYGFGNKGRSFIKIKDLLSPKLMGIIDKEKKEADNLQMYSPFSTLPDADLAIITMNNHYAEVEKLLLKRYGRYRYWDDLLNEMRIDY